MTCKFFRRRTRSTGKQKNCANCLQWCPMRGRCQVEKLVLKHGERLVNGKALLK